MRKDFLNLLSKWNVLAIALVAMMSVGLSSCGDDDDDIDDGLLGDYYFKFEVVDRGTLSDSEANRLVGALNTEVPTMTAYTKAEAVYVFDREIEDLRVGFSGSNDFEVSFKVSLMLKTSVVKSKIVSISRNGCTVK